MKDLSSKENELRCGSWRYYPEARLLGFDGSKLEFQNPIYEVHLDRLNTSGQLLDWILQIDRHQYEVSNFIRLFQLLCREFLNKNV